MNVTEAARLWAEYKRRLKALGPAPAQAEKVLKEYFAAHPEKPVRWGIAYSSTPTERLDLDMARSMLGPRNVAKCMVPGKRETLSLVDPEATKPKKAVAKKS